MKFWITTLVVLWLLSGVFPAWGQGELSPCGTSPEISELIRGGEAGTAPLSETEGILYTPVTIHIVGNSNGSGYVPIHQLMDAFCTLNRDFEPTGIQFFMAGDINYIDNTAWYIHPGFQAGAEMMEANNINNTLNCYIVEDPAGNCGYASSRGAALAKSCLFPGDHTWAHEMGHMLGLPHPFVGWENREHDYSTPAPTSIGNRPVEKVDGSNCDIAGDRFCDTPPDYLNFRWSCNDDSQSIQQQTDPNGETFRSDGTLIMSYSNDECANRFSGEQIDAMNSSLQGFWAGLAFGEGLPGDIPGVPPTLTAPTDGAVVPNQPEVVLSWEPVSNATHYIVEVARLPNIPFTVAKQITTTNTAIITGLQPNKDYFWRIRPFNPRYTCTPFSAIGQFSTDVAATVSFPEQLTSFEVYPNPLPSGQNLRAAIHARQSFDAGIALFSAEGVLVKDWGSHPIREGAQLIELSAERLPSGLYLLQVATPGGKAVRKVVAGGL